MQPYISVVVPNYNHAATIGVCLEAALSSRYPRFEVIVVDDASTDESLRIVRKFPCTLVELQAHRGAGAARNRGAERSNGDVLFFIDADCIMSDDTLQSVAEAATSHPDALIGGTYTSIPYDNGFFSTFQSVFVHYNETKAPEPDYIATHAMAIRADLFRTMQGFTENFLPILEDVEFSHRLRRSGYTLMMDTRILVRHIFGYTLVKSLKNAYRKSRYWTAYSLANSDLFRDSGTASLGLKAAVVSFALSLLSVFLFLLSRNTGFLLLVPGLFMATVLLNKGLIISFSRAKGFAFAVRATLYYLLVYPVPVALGALVGAMRRR